MKENGVKTVVNSNRTTVKGNDTAKAVAAPVQAAAVVPNQQVNKTAKEAENSEQKPFVDLASAIASAVTKVEDPEQTLAANRSQAEIEAERIKQEEDKIKQQALKEEKELNETFIKAVASLTHQQNQLIKPILKQEESASKIATKPNEKVKDLAKELEASQ